MANQVNISVRSISNGFVVNYSSYNPNQAYDDLGYMSVNSHVSKEIFAAGALEVGDTIQQLLSQDGEQVIGG